jgi:hypothetical protein
MTRHRKEDKPTGMEEARQALAAADRDLSTARDRWSVIHALTGKAHKVGNDTRGQRQINHLGDLFAHALGEG